MGTHPFPSSLLPDPVMAYTQLLILVVVVAATTAAPQFIEDNQPPIPHDFAYGVNDPETGDAKEHKQSVSASGRTEGEYRWLQPNGLYTVVKYFVDGDSGFQAEVSEEPGPAISNYYTNSLSQESSSGAAAAATTQNFARSFDTVQSSNVGRTVNVISAPRPRARPTFTAAPRPSPRPRPSFNTQQQQSFRGVSSGGFVDGGFIDGGIIDGGIIDGGIIDGGIINDDFDDDFYENAAVVLAGNN